MTQLHLNFNQGLSSIVNSVLNSKNRPTVISMIGMPDSGISSLTQDIIERLADNNVYGWCGKKGISREELKLLSVPSPDYLLFFDVSDVECSLRYIQETWGKAPDLKVVIYKDDFKIPVSELIDIGKGLYDLVIMDK